MTQWLFVACAYAIVTVATVAMLVASFVAMRRAEADADALKERR
jgi:hypothetical protein